MGIPVLPFSKSHFTVAKPLTINIVANPTSIGGILKNTRLLKNLTQTDVAKIFSVSSDTITNWEKELSTPAISHYPMIISFIGFVPFEETLNSLLVYRMKHGYSMKQISKMIRVDEKALWKYENGEYLSQYSVEKIQKYLHKK